MSVSQIECVGLCEKTGCQVRWWSFVLARSVLALGVLARSLRTGSNPADPERRRHPRCWKTVMKWCDGRTVTFNEAQSRLSISGAQNKVRFRCRGAQKKMAARVCHLPGLSEGRPGKFAEVPHRNFPPTADFQNCVFGSKVVVSRRQNDRFAERSSWAALLAGILFSKLVDLRGKIDGFCAQGLR